MNLSIQNSFYQAKQPKTSLFFWVTISQFLNSIKGKSYLNTFLQVSQIHDHTSFSINLKTYTENTCSWNRFSYLLLGWHRFLKKNFADTFPRTVTSTVERNESDEWRALHS